MTREEKVQVMREHFGKSKEERLQDIKDRERAKSDFPPPIPFNIKKEVRKKEAVALDFYKEIEKLEKELIKDALEEAKGVKSKAARLLNLNRTTLLMKIKKFNL